MSVKTSSVWKRSTAGARGERKSPPLVSRPNTSERRPASATGTSVPSPKAPGTNPSPKAPGNNGTNVPSSKASLPKFDQNVGHIGASTPGGAKRTVIRMMDKNLIHEQVRREHSQRPGGGEKARERPRRTNSRSPRDSSLSSSKSWRRQSPPAADDTLSLSSQSRTSSSVSSSLSNSQSRSTEQLRDENTQQRYQMTNSYREWLLKKFDLPRQCPETIDFELWSRYEQCHWFFIDSFRDPTADLSEHKIRPSTTSASSTASATAAAVAAAAAVAGAPTPIHMTVSAPVIASAVMGVGATSPEALVSLRPSKFLPITVERPRIKLFPFLRRLLRQALTRRQRLSYEAFMDDKNKKPNAGVILLSFSHIHKAWCACMILPPRITTRHQSRWSFPRGKSENKSSTVAKSESKEKSSHKSEQDLETLEETAIRECAQEVGYDLLTVDALKHAVQFDIDRHEQDSSTIRLFLVPNVAHDYPFQTRTSGEVADIRWIPVDKNMPSEYLSALALSCWPQLLKYISGLPTPSSVK